MKQAILLLIAVWAAVTVYAQSPTAPIFMGPQQQIAQHHECRIHEYSDALVADYLRKREELVQQGILAPRNTSGSRQVTQFAWPLKERDGYSQFSYFTVTNYVDQNPAVGQVLDYNCGTRTYDGHQGIDITLFPFWWEMMSDEQVEIVAAAPGTIVDKLDGHFDMNCSCTGQWNAVYVEHADGSVAWYGHMKSGTLTNKPVGSTVTTGEYLGLVGSSGCSTFPHLHFEVRDASMNVIEPFDGDCDSTNSGSWWISQRPYWTPQVNKLMTHSAPPNIDWCPNTESVNASNNFNSGDVFYMGMFMKDQLVGSVTNLSLAYPDGSLMYQWNLTSPGSYSRSWWYWYGGVLPTSAPAGTYTWRATHNGVTYEHYFTVNCPGSLAYEKPYIPADITIYANDEISTNGPVAVKSAGGMTSMQAPNGILLNPEFEVVKGANLTVQSGGCP